MSWCVCVGGEVLHFSCDGIKVSLFFVFLTLLSLARADRKCACSRNVCIVCTYFNHICNLAVVPSSCHSLDFWPPTIVTTTTTRTIPCTSIFHKPRTILCNAQRHTTNHRPSNYFLALTSSSKDGKEIET